MNQDNRVLSRLGARELTQEETDNVQGGLNTQTVCTHCEGFTDGDVGEC
jgi:hypothetical protein